MTRGRRIAVVIFAVAAVTVLGWMLLIGTVYALGGVATVRIEDRRDDLDLTLPVPMALVDLALAIAEGGLRSEAAHHGFDARWAMLAPEITELLRELEASPDATFVEIVDGRDTVRVAKRAGKFHVEISEPGCDIRVSVPARGLRRAASRLLG